MEIKAKYGFYIFLLRTKSDEFEPIRYVDIVPRLAGAYHIPISEARQVVAMYRLHRITLFGAG